MDFLKDAAAAVSDAAESAVDAVADVVQSGGLEAALKLTEVEVKKHTGKDIEIDTEGIPDDWKEWVRKTGCNSLCAPGSWTFLENDTKKAIWESRDIKKIVMKVKVNIEEDEGWIECMPEWDEGSTTLILVWYPRAGNWESDSMWDDPTGSKRWWHLTDEISFGLQLYQLAGKCFYKSDWLENFEDDDPDAIIPGGKKAFKRWVQFRHWIIYWYPGAMWGYNWQWTTVPPALPDGSLFDVLSCLKCPSLPDVSLPAITLPSLPGIELPDLPDLPDAPSLPDAPDISAPSLSAPDLSNMSMPDVPKNKVHPEGRWSAHGFIELKDMKVKADGKDVIFSGCTTHKFWKLENGSIDVEKLDNQRWVLGCTGPEQAESWSLTLQASGVEEGDAGGCCVVA